MVDKFNRYVGILAKTAGENITKGLGGYCNHLRHIWSKRNNFIFRKFDGAQQGIQKVLHQLDTISKHSSLIRKFHQAREKSQINPIKDGKIQ